MGKLTPTRHPYLFGGGISGLLIAGAVFAFVSMVAVVSQTTLPGSPSAGSNLPHGDLTIGADQGTVGEHAGPSSVTALLTAPTSAHAPGAVSGPTTAASNRTEGPRGAHAGSSGPTGGTNSGAAPGPQHGGPTSGNPGQGGQPPPPGEGPSGPGPDKEAPTEGPPGLAKKPGGLPPGLAKKSDGRPPGLAKKPDGLPPGLAKKPSGLPPGHARH